MAQKWEWPQSHRQSCCRRCGSGAEPHPVKLKTQTHVLLAGLGYTAASSLFVVILLLFVGLPVLFLRLCSWTPEEVPDALLPGGGGSNAHRIPSGILVLCCVEGTNSASGLCTLNKSVGVWPGVDAWGDEEEAAVLATLEPRDFLGAEAATAASKMIRLNVNTQNGHDFITRCAFLRCYFKWRIVQQMPNVFEVAEL